jgi:hypothetical protein
MGPNEASNEPGRSELRSTPVFLRSAKLLPNIYFRRGIFRSYIPVL